MSEKTTPLARLFERLRSFLRLNIENLKLSAAEKLTLTLSAIVIGVICLFFCMIVVFFASLALGYLLAQSMGYFWAFMIVAGIYLVLCVIFFMLRNQIVVNPIARAITKYIIK